MKTLQMVKYKPYIFIEKMNDLKNELVTVVGKPISQNQSPTLNAKLVKINKVNCTFEVTKSPYSNAGVDKVGQRYLVPIQIAWNSYFF